MKNIFVFCLLLLFVCGCSESEEGTKYFENGEYIGFADVDVNATREECTESGFLILDGIKIVENYDTVKEFIEDTSDKNNIRLRIALFHDEEGPAYADLIFHEGEYYFYYLDEESYPAEPYRHLLILEGEWGLPKQQYKMLVVSDNEMLTFDEVNKAMVSSSMDYINSVGRFRIVLFKY